MSTDTISANAALKSPASGNESPGMGIKPRPDQRGPIAAGRFPFPIPYGWYQVAFADEVPAGALRPLHMFGRDLVLWRSASGVLTLQDTYCPHLGANFAVGGEVRGELIRCPFHHWHFDTDGRVAEIPYARQLNTRACVRTYPLLERYGIVMAWYHPDGVAPLFELQPVPELEDDAYVTPVVTRHEIATCLQEMAENTADGAHFTTVHQHPGAAEYDRFVFEGANMTMESTQLFPSSGGPVQGTLASTSDGFGWGAVRYKTLIEVCMLVTNAPVDEGHVVQYFHVSWLNPERNPRIDRIGEAFNKEVNRQLTEDIPIWENKIYQPSPQLCDGDGPIARFRKWAAQFYAREVPA